MRELLGEEVDFIQEQNLVCALRVSIKRRGRKQHTIDVLTNHRELHIDSKSVRASCIRFYETPYIRKKPACAVIGEYTHHGLILDQNLVILAQSHQKDQCGDVLKTMYPLLPLASLPSYIEDGIVQVIDAEPRLGDAGGCDPAAQDVLVRWYEGRA